jgi:peptidoglycan hydrolase CwlO-like protein
MRNNPFATSLLIGLIVILIIAGVSLLVKMNALRDDYKKENAKKMSLEKKIEELKAEGDGLKETIGQLNSQVEELELENTKLNKLKDKLEESLKDELIKDKSGAQ